MMALILFIIGAVLLFTGRFALGNLNTQGRHVKAAGAVLMAPAAGSFVLSLIIGTLFAGNLELALSLLMWMAMFELIGMIAAVVVAYILIAGPRNAPRLPGILGEIQRERLAEAAPVSASQSVPTPTAAQPLTVARESFPTILTVSQAAQYLQVKEADILALIEAGKLPAARINYTYRIARSALDELMAARETA